ncbi:MAG: choice-of-anchor M domain-containing protein [Actinomycetaceae bacterium]|nr:choice-of-anchor M domain-containing protein [Actinomycetaceae bacterium]
MTTALGQWARRALALGGALALAGVGLTQPATQAAAAGDACSGLTIIDSGHVDAFEGAPSGKDFDLKLKWDNAPGGTKSYEPDETVLVLKSNSHKKLPSGYIKGVDSGYVSGQIQEDGVPWIGWDFMSLASLGIKAADLHLDEVRGPGQVLQWVDGNFNAGPQAHVDGKKAPDFTVKSGDHFHIEPLAHKHFNTLFPAKGVYRVKAHAAAGGKTTKTKTYTFAVDTDIQQACKVAKGQAEPTPAPTSQPAKPVPTKPGENGSDREQNTPGVNDIGEYLPGQGIELSANGFKPDGGDITFTFDEPRVEMLKAKPSDNGAVAATMSKIPEKAKPGAHTILVEQGKTQLVLALVVKDPNKKSASPSPTQTPGAPEDATNKSGNETGAVTTASSGTGQAVSAAPAGSAASSGEQCLPTEVKKKVSAAEATRLGYREGGGSALGLYPMMKDDRTAPAKWVRPDSLTFGIGDAGRANAPADLSAYGITGTVYVIGATQTPGVPWVGANTQNPSIINNVKDGVTWRLDSVAGPGKLLVFESGNFGKVVGNIWFAKTGDTHVLPLRTHVHPNWVFSAPGTYKVTVSEIAALKNGQTVQGSTTLTFVVGGQGNANEGHFDLGAEIRGAGAGSGNITKNADGTYTVTEVVGRTPSGKPCTLGGSLAKTGASDLTIPIAVLGLGVLIGGIGAVVLRRQFI